MGINVFEIDEEVSEIIDAKVGNPQNSTSKKICQFEPTLKSSLFFRVKFFNFFFIHMPKEYQSEKSPIFDSHKSPKTQRKLHIMSQLYASEVYKMFCNTRYNTLFSYLPHSAFS